MGEQTRVMLVGWDAADWKMIHPLMDAGLMPNTRSLVENGVMGNLATLTPVLSPMLWTSIATGKRPFKHGVLGFFEPTPDGSSVQPVSNLSRRTKAVWNILQQNGKRSLVVGWWPSHPAEPISGVMVSNHYQRAPKGTDTRWPLAKGTVHPAELAETLAELRVHPAELTADHVRPFVPKGHLIDQDKDRRLDMVLRTIADCTTIQACATHLLETEPWDFAAVYFDAIDHFGHGFMKYHPPRQSFVSEKDFDIYQNVMAAGYVYHDMMLGRLLELAGKETTVILMSDHGFHGDHLRPERLPVEPAGPAAEHRELGIFLMRGPAVKTDELIHGASLLDVTPTILTLFGLPIGEDMDGRPLVDAFRESPRVKSIPSWEDVPGDAGQHSGTRQMEPNEAREALNQLVALGYIDEVSDDKKVAVAQARREMDYNLAQAYMDAGQFGHAVPLLVSLYQTYPLEFRFAIQLALCLHTLGKTEDLARLVETLDTRWRRAAARARFRLRGIAPTARERREARAQDGTDEKAPLFSDEERRVVRTLRATARVNERTLDYLASLVATAKGDPDTALKRLEEAGTAQVKAPGFHMRVANGYLALKRHADAEATFRKVLELDPENAYAYLGLCRTLMTRRRIHEAVEAGARAVGLKYHFPAAHYFLGLARERSGDLDGAVRAYELAIEQNPNFPEAHSRLAGLFSKSLQDERRAREHRRAAAGIRRARTQVAATEVVPELPDLTDTAIDEQLPDFPQASQSLTAPLGAPPIPRAADADDKRPSVVVVSGLPRSGTSMMMQMLAAGGLEPHTDELREADENNPRGYYELEKVKRLAVDNTWVGEADGKVLKVVAPLLPYLPQSCRYRVVFMQRDLDEVRSSQGRMLERLDRSGAKLDEARMRVVLKRQVETVRQLLAAHEIPVLTVDYAEVLAEPGGAAARIAEFLGGNLDQTAMCRAVAPELRREQAGRSVAAGD